MSIKSKLLISYVFLIIFSVSILGFLGNQRSKTAVFNEVTEKSEQVSELINTVASVRNDLFQEKVVTDLNFVEKLLNNYGEFHLDRSTLIRVGNFNIPVLYAGNLNLVYNNNILNEIKSSTGAICTIFLFQNQKLIRITSNIADDKHTSIGTYLDNSSEVYSKLINKNSYSGIVCYDGQYFITYYKPIIDKNNNLIGAIALGYNTVNSYLEKKLNDVKIGKTGYVYIMNSKGDVLLHPYTKGANLINNQFAKEIVKNKNGVIQYEFNGNSQFATYKYFEPWDWYIVTTANYDDLNSASKDILKTIILTASIIYIIGCFIALFLANTLVKPIDKLKSCMEIASKGDLTVCCDVKSKDEIGVLSNSFNEMIKENKRLVDEIVKYDKVKTEFFANISHELKTPLNIIFSTSQLFSLYVNKDQLDTIKLNHYTDILKQNCYRLIRLVNNLIDITKIDSGFMDVHLKNENIVEIIENITLSTAEYIENKSRTIIFDTDVEEKIMAVDAEKMERIMLNLISNAIKFTKSGDVIEVIVNDNIENLVIHVKDTGIGIPKDKQTNIFERFKQVDPLLNRNHEGSGIGLSLVKSLVEMHNGHISVSSNYGHGTEFIINLPVRIVENNDSIKSKNEFHQQTNVEKIQIEFSDIYS